MSVIESLSDVLRKPTPAALWQLRGDMLEADIPGGNLAWETLDQFHAFLNQLFASMNAHEYSKLATLLDIGAVGGVALEHVIVSDLSAGELWKRLLLGGVSESLMVMASRQYVKAFEEETTAVYSSAAWFLYRQLWHLSCDTQPELASGKRRQLIDRLMTPIHAEPVTSGMKAVLIGRIFQVLLLLQIRALLDTEASEA